MHTHIFMTEIYLVDDFSFLVNLSFVSFLIGYHLQDINSRRGPLLSVSDAGWMLTCETRLEKRLSKYLSIFNIQRAFIMIIKRPMFHNRSPLKITL